jgi:hypothetical protein
MKTTSAATGWFVSVVAVLGLVLGLHHLGVNLSANVTAMVHDVELLLGQPLLPQ